jgi:hypothetical protein
MKSVHRQEVLSRSEYEKIRNDFRSRVMKQKDLRRIHLGEHLTFLFENHDTILYQVQEMMRAEQMDDEMAIRHEIETYNELIGPRGVLGCTLLIEIDDPAKRSELLTQWRDLPKFLYLETQSGDRVSAIYDERQIGDDRLSSVQYLKFNVGDGVPVKIGSHHPQLKIESVLPVNQAAALARDLIEG